MKEKRKESFTLPRISIKWKTKEFQKKKEKKIINSPLGIVKKAFCFTPNANSEGEKWEQKAKKKKKYLREVAEGEEETGLGGGNGREKSISGWEVRQKGRENR